MLYGLDKFNQSIQDILNLYTANPEAELEFRLGALKGGHFVSQNNDGVRIRDMLETDGYVFKVSRYTNVIFNDGVRMRDGETQKKTVLKNLDMLYAPTAIRLSLSTEVDISSPAKDSVPTSIREIERWTATMKEFPNVDIMISYVNNSDWEVELEFTNRPKTPNEVIRPLDFLLRKIMPSRVNVLDIDDITAVTRQFNSTWNTFPQMGFLRKITNKPLNFTREDASAIRSRAYAVSHKLDGEKYTLMCNDGNIYIVSEVDAMWIAESPNADKYHLYSFDCEWDAQDKSVYVYDWQTNTDESYDKRREFCRKMCDDLKCSNVVLKGAELCKPSNISKCIKSIVQWMKKTYGDEWLDRNDGIIFTPVDEPYMCSKEREHRILKYKFPDKISIDVRLRAIKIKSDEKIFSCWAAGPKADVEIRTIGRITVLSNDLFFTAARDNLIVELVLEDGVFRILRARPDKTEPNFISVVLDTVKDMRDPMSLDELTKLVTKRESKGGKGGKKSGENGDTDEHEESRSSGLIPIVPDSQFEAARKYINQDRMYFAKAYNEVLKFARERKLKMSNPECIIKNDAVPNVLNFYSSNALRDANDLANTLFSLTPIVFLKTVVPYEEFDVSCLNRHIAKILAYPRVKHIKTDELFQSVTIKVQNYDTQFIGPEIELIEIYHRLYMPFPEKWEQNAEMETALIGELNRTSGGASKYEERNEFARKVRTALYEQMEFNDFGAVLVGHWGFYELFPDSDPHNEKLQFLTMLEPEEIKTRAENVLRDVTPLNLSFKTEEVFIPHDPHLRRTTYYYEFKGARMPLFDTFNSLTYEMVPWIAIGDKHLKVGNPYVLSRFFLIDRWILNVLQRGGFVTADVYKNKSAVLISKVYKLRNKKEFTGGTEYEGTYKDFVIERRKLLKQEEKFRPYKPLEYMQKFNKLRTI